MSPLISTAKGALPAVPWRSIFAAVGGGWLLLIAAGLSKSLWGQLRLHRTYHRAASAPSRVLVRAQRIAAELGLDTPPIRVAEQNTAAFTYGALAPVIGLSASTCELADEQLDFVLRHAALPRRSA